MVLLIQPIRSTTQIWVETGHQHGISAVVTQSSIHEETSGGVAIIIIIVINTIIIIFIITRITIINFINPSVCVCGSMFTVDHVMFCQHGGLVIQRHNEIIMQSTGRAA